MGSVKAMVDQSIQAVENMKCHKEMEDTILQMQEYMKHNAEFQRRLISVRESRALWEKTQRMRKERASHMGFQFKQIVWQMRRAQDDAYVAQERYLKVLQLDSGHALRYQKGNATVQDKQENSLHVNRVPQESGYEANQDTSHQNEHQNQAPPYVQYNCAEDVADLDLTQGTSFRFFTTVEENIDSIGKSNCATQEMQSYLTPTNNSIKVSCEERLLIVPQQESREELEPIMATELSNESKKDDFVSTSLFVRGNFDSHAFLLEQRKKATDLVDGGNKVVEEQLRIIPLYDRKEDHSQGQTMRWLKGSTDDDNTTMSQLDLPVSTMPISVLHKSEKQDQEISWVQKSTDDGIKMENSELDLPVSIMPITPTAEEVTRRDVEKKRSEELRQPFLKIQKSDFLSQKIAKEIEEFTLKSSLSCFVSKPVDGSGDSWINRAGGACEVESTAEKNGVKERGDSINRMAPHGMVEKSGLITEEKRKIMKAWHPEEKIGVLRTITNTMFLWEIEQSSSQQQHYGSWPNNELIMSAAHAAKGSQRDLFEFLETIEESMSKPLICCGVVCELLKAYPPDNLLPSRFLEDLFASESGEANDQCMSGRLIEGLGFDHLEVYLEGEHKTFWQALVHHVVSINDHHLASLKQIAKAFVEILLPRLRAVKCSPQCSNHTKSSGLCWGDDVWCICFLHANTGSKTKLCSLHGTLNTRMEDFPAQKVKGLQQDLLQFLVSGFKSKTLHLLHGHDEDDESAAAQKRLQHVSKDSEGTHGFLDKHRTDILSPFQQATGFSQGYKLRRSSHLRPVSTRKGLLSCFGSRVRTNFRIWSLKPLSRGVDTVDDALVCLLRKNG